MKKVLLITLILLTTTSYSQRSRYKNLFEQNGKIGIGTDQPDALLTVKGDIHAQEVLVDLKGAVAPDYVFERYYEGASTLKPSYRFLSLGELELFIKENHHLPGVPSAETLEKDGLSLKQMNLILLEKVEELTLHVLEQKKEIELLKEKYASLKE
ncbi:MAG: hypothetical protein ACI83B_001755 [Sediminicola sp.]|jgi:hypothetical protein|tara:strand:+ start:3251 stop:3715 length:465 start_codon:yes stop_codon:yes gene_type:complete